MGMESIPCGICNQMYEGIQKRIDGAELNQLKIIILN